MPRYAVDASVAAKWYFEEEHSAEAARLLAEDPFDLLAPDFIRLEVAAAAWKRVIRAEIEPEKAEEILRELGNVPIELAPTVHLIPSALTIALQVRRTVYDSIYLAHAVQGRTAPYRRPQALRGAQAASGSGSVPSNLASRRHAV